MEEVKKPVEKKAEVKAIKKPVEKKAEDTFIMKVGHLTWGSKNKNHFYADRKPLITEKVMGQYAETLLTWIEAGWIEEGSYK